MDIKETVFELTGFEFGGRISESAGDRVHVRFDGENAEISYAGKAQRARCFFLLAEHAKNGPFEITETPAFETVGPMLDVSRGRVLTVGGVKKILDRIAALGMNMVMLYTEDTYEIEGRPFFGYQRGRYSLKELREIDDYAYELGIEVIPCIQTFGHLEMYLRWKEASAIKENERVLLPDEEETYEFIEQEIKTVRSAFRSQRIHLGMDETRSLGLGNYLKKHGLHPMVEIFNKHLARVLEIAKKYFARPMIWSDMLFESGSGKQYDPAYQPPQSVIDATPKDVELVYWSYYRDEQAIYADMIEKHKRFGNDLAFGGGVWTWDGIAPNFDYTVKTTVPALRACIEGGVKTVIATMWCSGGDCGADLIDALPGLALFSEYCYKGVSCTEEDVYLASDTLFGVDKELQSAISAPYFKLKGAVSLGKGLFFCDPLINLIKRDEDLDEVAAYIAEAEKVLERRSDYERARFYLLFDRVCRIKAQILGGLRRAYKAGDRAFIERTASELLPELGDCYAEFCTLFLRYWRENYKPFGLEHVTVYLGGARQRVSDAITILRDYLDGKTERIDELEEEVLPGVNATWRGPDSYMSTRG